VSRRRRAKTVEIPVESIIQMLRNMAAAGDKRAAAWLEEMGAEE
jgi:hypothetical protein